MRLARLLLAGVAGTMAALAPMSAVRAEGTAPTTAPSTQPGDLDSYSDLIKKCIDYDQLSSNWKWTTIYTADFRPGQPPTWHPDPAATDIGNNQNPSAVQTSIIHEDGHDDLLINGQMCNFCFSNVGPKIRGDIAVDMLCKSMGPRLNDLSIVLGGFHTGPGFQFGSNDNTKALLWPGAGPNDNPASVQSVVPTGSPQTIQLNQWYHIRMEVKNGEVRAIVDGHEIGKMPLNPHYPLQDAHQPFLYTYNSQMVVRELHVEAYARDPKGVDPNAWSKVFGSESPSAVQNQLDDLVRFLADRDPAVRDKAEGVLSGMGELAIPALQRAAASDIPELTVRAATILRNLSASGRSPVSR